MAARKPPEREKTAGLTKTFVLPLQKFFAGVELAVLGGVVERDIAVGAFFELVDFAGVKGLGIDVNADGALIVFGEIQNLVNGFEGIDIAGIGSVHFVNVGRHKPTGAGVVGKGMAVFNAEILNFEAADGGRHPAVLVAMVVNARELADFPADGHAFEEIVFEDQVAGVTALREIEIFFERFRADVMADDEVLDVFKGKILCGDGGEIFDPVGDGELFGDGIVGHQGLRGIITVASRERRENARICTGHRERREKRLKKHG